MSPIVSVIMPFQNERAYIAEAIASVLNAGCENIEILCIEDKSSDGTVDVLQNFQDSRIKIHTSRGEGISAALNTGLDAAIGQYVARCDGDDRYIDGRLEHQLQMLKERPNYVAICGAFQSIDHTGKLISKALGSEQARDISDRLKRGKAGTHLCTFLMRRSTTKQLRFRPWFETAEDIDFQHRLAELGRIWYDPIPVYQYRLHNNSITHRQANDRRIFFNKAATEFAQQRMERGSDDLTDGDAPQPPETGDLPGSANIQVSGQLLGRAWKAKHEGRYFEAVLLGFKSCLRNSGSLETWRSMAALIIKRRRI